MRTARILVIAALTVAFTTVNQRVRAEESIIPKDMVYIGQGPSIMGLDKEDPKELGNARTTYHKRNRTQASTLNDESPAHMVFLDSYLIDKYEVSNKDYGDFIKANGHGSPAYWDDPRLNSPNQPVVGVSWYDARAYCEYRGKRLPTEAEWEKAARGPNGNLYPWGDDFDPAKANYGKNHDGSKPVDSYPDGVSYYGLHNMAGNVFEWVLDWYDPRYYSRLEPMVNPTGPEKPVWIGGTGTYVDLLTLGEKRVIRGGSWVAPEGSVRSTHRFWNHPLNNSYGVGLGFRCAKTAPSEIDQRIKEAAISTYLEMGRERFEEARQTLDKGLALDPKNTELLELRQLIEQSIKRR
jgi:formylglycine-generating enzyme required for sulfatase activity